MKHFKMGLTLVLMVPFQLYAVDSFYCPQKHAYIKIGMTKADILKACGQPLSKSESDTPPTQKVPVTQLIYNHQGTNSAFYGIYNIPIGSGGARLEVDIVNNKVASIRINGTISNSASICDGNIAIGDPPGKVYSACGSPSLTNNTYINQVIPGDNEAETWMYRVDRYHPPFRLTFVNGTLQSID